MKAQIIPAQITTVEDRIVGNLSLAQLLILISPVVVVTLAYTLMPPSMKLVGYKASISLVAVIAAVILSLRIKGKVVVSWLGIIFAYNLRPKYYVYNKNDTYLRTMDVPEEKKNKTERISQVISKESKKNIITKLKIQELISFEELVHENQVDFRYKTSRKGGMNVAFNEVKR